MSFEHFFSIIPTGSDPVFEVALQNSIDSHDRHNVKYALALSDFEYSVSQHGYKVRGITPDDGNCFFWAMSDQLALRNNIKVTHSELRENVVQHVRNKSQVRNNASQPFFSLKSRIINLPG